MTCSTRAPCASLEILECSLVDLQLPAEPGDEGCGDEDRRTRPHQRREQHRQTTGERGRGLERRPYDRERDPGDREPPRKAWVLIVDERVTEQFTCRDGLRAFLVLRRIGHGAIVGAPPSGRRGGEGIHYGKRS